LNLKRYIAGALLVVTAVLATQMWPDIVRYRRMRDM